MKNLVKESPEDGRNKYKCICNYSQIKHRMNLSQKTALFKLKCKKLVICSIYLDITEDKA